MIILQSDSEDEETFNVKIEQIEEMNDDSESEYSFFDNENRLVNKFQDLNNPDIVNKKDVNFNLNKNLLIKNGYNENKIQESKDKVYHLNHDALKKQLNGKRNAKGEMYIRFANKFLR